MLVEEVHKLKPLDQFMYWVKERHRIYLWRKAGKPKPWTDDEILRGFYFTNPYREHDKTTEWFRERLRDPMRDSPDVLFTTVCFRWFNLISTGEVLDFHNLFTKWDRVRAIDVLQEANESGPVFTGAYMIKGETGRAKIESVCDRIDAVWDARERLVKLAEEAITLQEVWAALCEFPYLGGFMSYEVVCDLRYTYLLNKAIDINTWCNPGPGCARGLMRLAGIVPPKNRFGKQKRNGNPLPGDWLEQMKYLLDTLNKKLYAGLGMPRFEMREVEHSLCEYDKYCRALHGDGKMKRTYNG